MAIRPDAAFCHPELNQAGPSFSSIHAIDIFLPYHGKYMTCWNCDQIIVHVDKSDRLGPSDVGYQFVTSLKITEWP